MKHYSIPISQVENQQMDMPSKKAIIMIIFAVLTLAAIMVTYFVQQNPTQEEIVTTLCVYSSTVEYDYTAMLEPNTIYGNRTVLAPYEGTLYTALTKQINLTLSYTFEVSLSAVAEVTYSLKQVLQSASWQYQLKASPQTTTNQTQISLQLPPFNRTDVESTKAQIEKETGTTSGNYSFQVVPIFTVDANTSAGPIHQTLSPILTIEVGRTGQGNVIAVENLHQKATDSITEERIVMHDEVTYARYAAYIFSAICIIGLATSAFKHRKAGAPVEMLQTEKLISPYKDLVVEAKAIPEFSEDTLIIEVRDLEELAKTAEILARPIFHAHSGSEHSFYVFDTEMTYVYRTGEKEQSV